MKSKVNWPALNWFIHVLIKNVGKNVWIRMSKEEQAVYDKEHPYNAGYPYKVVTSPIPKGKNIVLHDSRKMTIKCDSVETRGLIEDMATAYDELEKMYYHAIRENRASEWHKVELLPPHSPVSSSCEEGIRYLVWSKERGVNVGFRSGDKWFAIIGGTPVHSNITHFRHIPPGPSPAEL